ncbi:histidine kinase [Paenibacillus ferrarius]|uniref:histidine kinase n=1 Tax=Paenibacillus ferrarius TaxID=1469647 RepID=A0A1V4HIP3_9BACL|nr:sensor histidine kinase [Paenibacillus ferrarius]OPH55983.1 histidine kinase [Paenibacillus ferrarius]
MNNSITQRVISFRNKMILIFIFMTIIPFVLFAYYAHLKSVEGISHANSAFAMDYTIQSKENFDGYLAHLNNQINDVIGNSKLQQLLAEEPKTSADEIAFSSEMLNLVYQNMPYIDAFQVRVVPMVPSKYPNYMSSRILNFSGDIENEAWFKQSIRSVTPTWHLFRIGESQHAKPLLSKVKRFSGLYDQTPRGIVVTDLSDDQLNRYLSPSHRIQHQHNYLIDENGIVLYDSADNQSTGSPIASTAFQNLIRESSEGAGILELDGVSKLATYVRLNEEPWFLVSTIPLDELTGPIREINRVFFMFLVVYLICCIGVVFYLTVYFTNPLLRLVRSMRRLEFGEFQHVLPNSRRKDEIGWLYRGFNNMAQRIQELIEQSFRAERAKKELEFQVLSHQINPHFLYNTLESIRWKAASHHMDEISEMVSSLGNLLRLSLNQGKEITTMAREIEHVKAYVNIEQARLGAPVRILYSVEEGIGDFPFLRLLLQPLVENAIHHGIRSNFDKGKIILSARRDGGDIVIELMDNGEGIRENVLASLNSPDEHLEITKRRGVGLRNVNERLKLYFGESYKLIIENSNGTKIILRHPIMEKDEQEGKLVP